MPLAAPRSPAVLSSMGQRKSGIRPTVDGMTSDDNASADETQAEQHDNKPESRPDSDTSSDTSSSDTIRDDGIETDVHGDVDTVS